MCSTVICFSSVPEFIDPVFAKRSPIRSFSKTRNQHFGLVFQKTGSVNSGTESTSNQNLNEAVHDTIYHILHFSWPLKIQKKKNVSVQPGEEPGLLRCSRLVTRGCRSVYRDNLFLLFVYVIILLHLPPLRFHCVGGDAGIEPRTVVTLTLTARRCSHSARSHPPRLQVSSTSARSQLTHFGQILSTSARSHLQFKVTILR